MKNRNAAPAVGTSHRAPAVRPVGRGDAVRDRSDDALVALAASGDASACAELYDRYGRFAYALALRILADARLAEAAVEEGFAALWGASGQLAPNGTSASTWILTLVHRQAIASLRRTHRTGRARPALDGRRTPSGERRLGLESERAEHAVDGLPRAEYETLASAYLDGLTVSELAARFGQPLGAIKATLHAALSHLGATLTGEAGHARTPAGS